jgi:hypothetical protein
VGFGIGVGPRLFRVRVSTRGVGLSSGVGPVSVWTSTRRRSPRRRSSGHATPQAYSFRPDAVSMTDHTGARAGGLVSTTGDAIVSQLTRADRWLVAWSWVYILSLIAGLVVPWLLLLALASFLLAWLGFLPQRVNIEYEVDDSLTRWFGDLAAGWPQLANTKGRWRLQSSTHLHKTHDRKVNAGAGSLVSRHTAQFRLHPPRALKVNMKIPTIKARGHYLIFLPDRVLVKSGLRWSDVDYSHLTVKDSQSRFIEHKTPPRDGVKVDERWQYANVKGGPDKRFKNNRRLPVMLYDEVSLTSDTGLSWIIQLSRHDPAKWWEAILQARPVSQRLTHNAVAPAPVAAPADNRYRAKDRQAAVPQSNFAAHAGSEVPVFRDSAKPKVDKPLQWWPRAGWGTVRGYRIENNQGGRVSLSFYFVPDDGSEPRQVVLTNTVPMKELGEYARGIMRGDNFTVKVSVESMARAESLFQQINGMEFSERKAMFADRTDIDGDAGWSWTSDYRLVKVAPGLLQ